MKITPDASMFQALSNFPRANREAINPAPHQARDADTRSKGGKAVNTDAREAARQEAIHKNRAALEQAQEQLRQRNSQQAPQATKSQFAGNAGASTGATATGQIAQSGGQRQVHPHYREAPGTEERPRFVRMGQFVDISV